MSDNVRQLDLMILHVEDSEDQREAIKNHLTGQTNWRVFSTSNSTEFWEEYKGNRFHAVLIDQILPYSPEQGEEIAKAVFKKRIPGWQPIIVLLTDVAVDDQFARGGPMGDAYIEKARFAQQQEVLIQAIETLYIAAGSEPEGWPLRYRRK